MSGLELTCMLKRNKDFDGLSIIMLTARAEEHDKVSALDDGADEYIQTVRRAGYRFAARDQ